MPITIELTTSDIHQLRADPATWAAVLTRLEAALPAMPTREQIRLAPWLDTLARAARSTKPDQMVQLPAWLAERITDPAFLEQEPEQALDVLAALEVALDPASGKDERAAMLATVRQARARRHDRTGR